METYEDIESRLAAQQGFLFWIKRLLFGVEELDPSEIKSEREETKTEFQTRSDSLQQRLDHLENQIAKSRETGVQLPDSLEMEVDDFQRRRDELSSFQSKHGRYLRAEEHETLSSLSSRLADLANYLEAKRAFDEQLAQAVPIIESFREDAHPYLEYNKYLTAPAAQRLHDTIPEVRDEINTLRTTADFEALAAGDRERVEQFAADVDAVEDVLEDYNETFVEQQRTVYEGLFTDIDEADHDLNPAQQRAIVRNGYYNQVVAGAGTGKTFALVYRIAYLVREGVDPSRIVALTYTKKAAAEMEARLEAEFSITDVEVRTIHSFAYKIAAETADEPPEVVRDRDTYNLIEDVLAEAETGDDELADHYLQFLYHYDDGFLDEATFHEKTDYVAERREQTYETLAGEEVSSEAEKIIADFLFTHGVTYQYESIAEWADTSDEKSAYRPDFYLPAYDLYIEHWGINEDGEVAPWFSWSTEKYREKLRWARAEFERNDPGLIDTYEFEHEAGRLERALEHRLRANGVALDRMGFDEFVDEVFAYNQKKGDIKESFKRFIENAKTFDIAPAEIPDRLDRNHPRQFHFGQCGWRLLERYNAYLERNGLLDFNDMIYDAIEAIEAAPASFQDRYDHLLVDEFQDVGLSQIRLIRLFVGPDADTHLFCVGDDWQSIYAFQGSQVSYFVNFGDHFGPPSPVITRLTANYRCPETVIEASNSLIANNDEQIEKTVEAYSGRDCQPTLHTLDGYKDWEYQRRVGMYAANLVEQFIDEGSDPSDIMILCRYDEGAPYINKVKQELEGRDIPYDGKDDVYRPADMAGENEEGFEEEAGVSAFSVHQAKGREADHVVLLHAVRGPMGFPPDDREDDLIAPVQDVPTNTMAEERRLFYVALTRAGKDLHVMTRAGETSPFVTEVESFLEEQSSVVALGDEGDRLTVTARVDKLWENTHTSQHQAGVLADKAGSTRFVSWKSDDPPTVRADTWYKFEGLRVSEYNDEPQLVIDDTSRLTALFNERPLSEMGGEQAPVTDEGGSPPNSPVESNGGYDASKTDTVGGSPPVIADAPDIDISYDDLDKGADPIGRGGEAVVYGARASIDGEEWHLAVKEPDQRGTLDTATVRRFLDEAETWAALADHDHIVDVVGSGSQPLPWIAMEYMDGGNLHSRLGTMSFEQAVWTGLAVVKAVRYAHNRGVRHYDLKPENILFRTVAGEYWDIPKVGDWGLAEEVLRSAGPSNGLTPAYAAPEQLFEEYGEPDHRTDIYQLGLLCYELFTGDHPYDGDQTRSRSATLTPPSEVTSELPSDLDDLLMPALAVDPDDRYEDVLDLRRGLESLR